MNFGLELYRQMFLKLRRGKVKGGFSNAKPLLILTFIDQIPNIGKNIFIWGENPLEHHYKFLIDFFNEPNKTPIWKPFYFMSSEPFYTLVWKKTPPAEKLKAPSSKILKDYLDHAELDPELWELLQDADNREYLKRSIIEYYFEDDTNDGKDL